MKAPRLAIVLLAVAASALPLTSAGALSVPTATQLTLPSPNSGLSQGYLPFQSCASAGNCAVAGIYVTARGYAAGVIENEVKGVWRRAIAVTPPQRTSASKGVVMDGLSCAAAGSCVALGQYDTATNQLPFTVTEVHGVWRKGVALALPLGAVGTHQLATPHAISCPDVGYCTVVGTYTTATVHPTTQGFISSEVHGVWHVASALRLPAGVNADPLVSLSQVSCYSTSGCVAVGSYFDANSVSHDLTVSQVNGHWQTAVSVPLPGNASAFSGAQFNEVDCTSSGSCMVAGTYNTVAGAVQPLVALSGVSGVAGFTRALEVPLPAAAPNPETLLFGFKGISCAAPGDCAFGGQFVDANGHAQGFLDEVTNARVQRAHELLLPTGAVQAGHNGGVVTVDCPAIGTCVAGGAYLSATKQYEAILTTETNNVWTLGTTITLPAKAATVGVAGGIYSVQCFSTSSCEVSGSYQSSTSRYDGFALTTG